MKLVFSEQAWSDYLYWQSQDRKRLDRVNALIKDCLRSPFAGLGKPEPLRGQLSGWWSRRVDQEHRLVYRSTGSDLLIAQCRYHYER